MYVSGLEHVVGQKLAGRYLVERQVGCGGMAVVFLGRHMGLDRAVAVKMLRPEYTKHSEIVSRFEREARAASKFEHPNCIQVFDCGQSSEGLLFMVMPFLQGRELAKALSAPLPPSQAIVLAEQVARGLDYAHRRGVIHRDLKPDNIFASRDHNDHLVLKLVDFGIAKFTEEADGCDELHTRVGSIVGTPAYMSPEQALGGDVDVRADLYSLGVVLYQMLTRRLPFTASDARGLLFQHIEQPPPPLPDHVPSEVADIVMRLLEKNPTHRCQSAREVLETLAAARHGLAHDVRPWVDLFADRPSGRPTTPAPSTDDHPSGHPSRTGQTIVAASPSAAQPPLAPPRPRLRTRDQVGFDPTARPAPSSHSPSERSGVSVLHQGTSQAGAQSLADFGAALEDFLAIEPTDLQSSLVGISGEAAEPPPIEAPKPPERPRTYRSSAPPSPTEERTFRSLTPVFSEDDDPVDPSAPPSADSGR